MKAKYFFLSIICAIISLISIATFFKAPLSHAVDPPDDLDIFNYTVPKPTLRLVQAGGTNDTVAVQVFWNLPEEAEPDAYGFVLDKQGPLGRTLAANYYPAEKGFEDLTDSGFYYDEAVALGDTYKYYIKTYDRSGKESEWASEQITLISIENIKAEVLSPTSVKITWNTVPAAQCKVEYSLGTDNPSYNLSSNTTASGTAHSVTLQNLASNKDYTFRIKAWLDNDENKHAYSDSDTFKAEGITILEFKTTNIGAGGATFYLKTDQDSSTAKILCGKTSGTYTLTSPFNNSTTPEHTINWYSSAQFTPTTTYYCKARAYPYLSQNDAASVLSPEITFTTLRYFTLLLDGYNAVSYDASNNLHLKIKMSDLSFGYVKAWRSGGLGSLPQDIQGWGPNQGQQFISTTFTQKTGLEAILNLPFYGTNPQQCFSGSCPVRYYVEIYANNSAVASPNCNWAFNGYIELYHPASNPQQTLVYNGTLDNTSMSHGYPGTYYTYPKYFSCQMNDLPPPLATQAPSPTQNLTTTQKVIQTVKSGPTKTYRAVKSAPGKAYHWIKRKIFKR